MKIVDTGGSLLWRMTQRSGHQLAKGELGGSGALKSKLQELHRLTTTSQFPQSGGYYAEGRATLRMYADGFAEIRKSNEHYGDRVQNARMTDQDIAEMIERMNMSAR
jgi:hypothetical protein